MGRVKFGVYLNCEYCNKEIYKKRSQLKNHSFCSYSCSAKWKRARNISGKKKYHYFLICPVCHQSFHSSPSILKTRKNGVQFCSQKCKIIAMKTGMTKWSFQKSSGFPNNPYVRKQVNGIRMKEHRRVIEAHLKRRLLPDEVVHHINGDPKDNRIENLQLLSASEHAKIHKKR